MYEFDEGLDTSKYFYDPEKIQVVQGLYVVGSKEKENLEEKQGELYRD